ncbi:MAG: hypothetical protein KY476_10600 [Planctomycetes bacterium]|nr:hypothetical protein [Planctomycetota bacterium]
MSTALWLLLGASAGHGGERPGGESNAGAAGTLVAWIEALGAESYAARREATHRLTDAGPTAIGALLNSADWSNPEVAARGVGILRVHAEGEQHEARQAATSALGRLSANPSRTVARMAADTLQRAQRQTLSIIQAAGGTVEYGDAEARSIVGIHLQRCRVANGVLERLRSLESLERLNLASSGVTDEGLVRVASFRNLRYLNLQSNPVTNAGIAHLGALGKLDALYLSGTRVDAAALEHLAGMGKLRILWLNYTRVGDDAVPALKRLTSLKHLRLTGSYVTAAAVEELKAALPETRITP